MNVAGEVQASSDQLRVSLVAVATGFLTAVTGVFYAAVPKDGAWSAREIFILAWLLGPAALAFAGAFWRGAQARVLLRTIAAVAMILAGGAGASSIGLPVAVGGVIGAIATLADVERAAEENRHAWLFVGTAAVTTFIVFAIGLQLTGT